MDEPGKRRVAQAPSYGRAGPWHCGTANEGVECRSLPSARPWREEHSALAVDL